MGRHSYAGDPVDDPKKERERPLLPEGVKIAKAIANAMLDAGEVPDVIFASPFVRAAQTADIYGRILGVSKVVSLGDLAPWRPLTPALTDLVSFRGAEKINRVLLVGHVDNTLPAMTDLAGRDKWKPLVMGEVRRVKMNRNTLRWSLRWGVKPSDVGMNDYDS